MNIYDSMLGLPGLTENFWQEEKFFGFKDTINKRKF